MSMGEIEFLLYNTHIYYVISFFKVIVTVAVTVTVTDI